MVICCSRLENDHHQILERAQCYCLARPCWIWCLYTHCKWLIKPHTSIQCSAIQSYATIRNNEKISYILAWPNLSDILLSIKAIKHKIYIYLPFFPEGNIERINQKLTPMPKRDGEWSRILRDGKSPLQVYLFIYDFWAI